MGDGEKAELCAWIGKEWLGLLSIVTESCGGMWCYMVNGGVSKNSKPSSFLGGGWVEISKGEENGEHM